MNIFVLSIIICVIFLAFTVELIRRQKIAEQYSILWLVLGLIMLMFSVFPELLERVAAFIHIDYAPSLLFFISLLFLLAIIMHFTMVISKIQRKLTRVIQEVALLKEQLNQGQAVDKEEEHS